MKWLCNKFSYPWEDDLIRDFNKETYSNIDFEKELNINQFEQNYEEEIDFDIYQEVLKWIIYIKKLRQKILKFFLPQL